MSYDYILWRGAKDRRGAEVWKEIAEGSPDPSLERFDYEVVLHAFRRVFGDTRIESEPPQTILGRGFELQVGEQPFLQVTGYE